MAVRQHCTGSTRANIRAYIHNRWLCALYRHILVVVVTVRSEIRRTREADRSRGPAIEVFFLSELPTKKLNKMLRFFVSVGDVITDTSGLICQPYAQSLRSVR